ncbi:hypothetical protein C7271_19240 [filamentous cyanobacterium CCP5]|nr:hypothetical protein C7271_19240 [filamentous cyanobacterium CCP5]
MRRRFFWLSLLLLVWLLCSGEAQAGPLQERLEQFPDWTNKPPVQVAEGDLIYPNWMAGTWQMTTTLVDLAAPLAPEVVTPGFEGNQDWLDQPIACLVRFVPEGASLRRFLPLVRHGTKILSDRAFNALSLARAYLGEEAVQTVRVDPTNPNRQVTLLQGGRQLESTITRRAVETLDDHTFVTSEVYQQIFRGTDRPYLNEVETTTAYRWQSDSPTPLMADQVAAIYLSPKDEDYFKAINRPVALYRYHLEFEPVDGIDT